MLGVLGKLYGKVMDLRNALYDRSVFEVHDLGARTISIGNITTGGTGKTPLVAYVADLLLERGEKVCILSRGYGREAKGRVLVSDGLDILETDPRKTGDEPLELARKLNGKAVVIADADRVAAAEWAKRRFGATAFVLDDGFQHRRAKRDVDIVCVDATKPLSRMRVLPEGRLRESLSGLERADAIVITRADLVNAAAISDFRTEISDLAPQARVFESSTKLSKIEDLNAGSRSKPNLKGERVFAFCGLGDPDSFFAMLGREGIDLCGSQAFADHHRYIQADAERITSDAAGCEALVTTAKDAVKLEGLRFGLPCLVAEIDVLIDDAEAFAGLI